MASFLMARSAAGPHDEMTLMHIYLISVSLNRMLISQLRRFLCVKFVFTSIQCLILRLFLISMLKKSYTHDASYKHHPCPLVHRKCEIL